MTSFFIILIWLLSGGFTLVIGVAALLYIRRTWQQIRAEEEGSIHERILDGVDELNVRMHGLNERLRDLDERLDRVERRLPEGTIMARIAPAGAEEDPGSGTG